MKNKNSIFKIIFIFFCFSVSLFAAESVAVPEDLKQLTTTLIYLCKMAGIAFLIFMGFDFLEIMNKNEINSSSLLKVIGKLLGAIFFMNAGAIAVALGLEQSLVP